MNTSQNEITELLPSAIDSLATYMEEGLDFDQALSKLAEESDNVLGYAFNQLLQEAQQDGKRRQALTNMSDRLDVPEMRTFVNAILDADKKGVSIVETLRNM